VRVRVRWCMCVCVCVGKFAKGVGSPHTKRGYVWHIALSMQALTSTDPREIRDLIATCEVRSRYFFGATKAAGFVLTTSVRCVVRVGLDLCPT
jgi:hypothetical protein